MGTFQEMMKESTKKLKAVVVTEQTEAEAAVRRACDAFILESCDEIRRMMEQEKTAGTVRYDLLAVNGSADKQEVNPHYRIRWNVEVEVNFKKRDKYYEVDAGNHVLRFGYAIPVFYVLEEMEKNLAKDQIVPIRQQEKKVGLFRRVVGTETVRVPLHRPEICNGLDAASRDHAAGFTSPHLEFVTGSDFAYFLTENNQEGK